MTDNTRNLARASLLTALGAAIMYISAVVPTARAGLVAIAGLMTCAALLSCGLKWAWGVFAATAALSFLILPLKSCAVLYACFLGWYPVAKSMIEHIKSRTVEWIVKFLLFNAALAALFLLAREVLTDGGLPELQGWMIAAAAVVLNIVFFIYDVLITRLAPLYISRVAGKIFKQGGQKP